MTAFHRTVLISGTIFVATVAILSLVVSPRLPAPWDNVALAIVGVIWGWGTWWFVRRNVMARLARLNATLCQIAASGDLAARSPITGRDELAQLAGTVNDMLAAVERAQRERRVTEERYRAVIEQTVDGIYWAEPSTGRVLETNAAFQALLGYTAQQLARLTVFDFIVDERAAIEQRIEHLLRERQPLAGERQYRRSDGAVLDVWTVANAVVANDRPVLAAIVRDITARKQVETELAAHARQQIAVAELGQRALIGTDVASLMREAVGMIIRTLDIEHAKVLELGPDGTATLAQGAASGPFLPGEPVNIEFSQAETNLTDPLSHDLDTLRGASVVIHGQSGPLGMLGAYSPRQRVFSEDEFHFLQAVANVLAGAIERGRAERALQESERRYRTVFDSASDAVFIHDLSGRLLEVNRVACERLGYSREELLKQQPIDVIVPEYAARVLEPMEDLQQQGRAVFETVQVQRTGHQLPVEVSSRLIQYDGAPAVLSIARDVTERKQAEAALEAERALLAQRVEERTAELSAANAALAGAARLKDEFLASMSHELRTPLNTILGMTEALEEEAYGPLNEDQLASLKIVGASGRHLLELINDILDLSKIGAGKLELEIGPVPVESICQASLGLIKQSAHKKRLRVSFNFEHTVAMMMADARRLKQILVNLLSNAVKFTPEGGEIGLEVTGDEARQAVCFAVWDTGIGIAKQDLDKLFQPFVQLDSRLARQYGGTGLGLALTYRMAEMHGGGISVQSEPGQGSRFTVSLPWQMVDPSAEETADGTSSAGVSGDVPPVSLPMAETAEPLRTPFSSSSVLPKILLADDNQGNINTLSQYLEAKGYRILVARNGSEAITRAREELPDVILMDIQMPMMDGLEATRHIRADARLAHVPVIALTALAMPGDRERCLAAGMNDYMSKPISLKELVRAIETQIWKGI